MGILPVKKAKAPVVYFEPFSKNLRGDELGNLAPYRQGRPHRGQDWAPKEKSGIKAITSGKVTAVFWSDVLGNCVIHNTADGLFVLYAHLAAPSELKVGHNVVGGETKIGNVGGGANTPSGSASTGAHLHLSISKKKDVHLCNIKYLVEPIKHIHDHAAPKAA